MKAEEIAEKIKESSERGTALRILGSGSKDFYGNPLQGEDLHVGNNSGIIDYEPSELILTAKAGTPLGEIENILSLNGQMLAFEPPHFGENATLGGALACGFSGPRRPFTGSARSFTLGTKIADGTGRILSYGGRVMKNVAGYDVSRLMAGSLGTLGVILETSLKVLPAPEAELTGIRKQNSEEAIAFFSGLARKSLPVSGASWHDGKTYIRLSGPGSIIHNAAEKIGFDAATLHDINFKEARAEASFWEDLREQRLSFFQSEKNIWRISVSPSLPASFTGEDSLLIDWMGSLRWICSDRPAEEIHALAESAGGHATLFRKQKDSPYSFLSLPPEVLKLHRELKDIFDPKGILNPGRMHPEL